MATTVEVGRTGSYEGVFQRHRSFLWGLLFRMTGCAADADDLLQETFVRLLEKPPADSGRPLEPWLVRVGMNLARDFLRRRRRSPYVGPWLPSPVATGEECAVVSVEARAGSITTEGRYDLLESMSMAFLVAIEALTPQQRAVLLLRDVFDYTVGETAEALGTTADAVKSAHLRARRGMRGYDVDHAEAATRNRDGAAEALWRFAEAVASGDVARIESLLVADVRATSDGGGEFYAALRPIVGANDVARFYGGIFAKFHGVGTIDVVTVAGAPALLVTLPEHAPSRLARRFVLQVEVAADGRIARLYSVLASRKLTHVGAATGALSSSGGS